MGFESFPHAESPRAGGRAARRSGRLIRRFLLVCGCVWVAALSSTLLRAESPARFPSKVILGLRSTCMTTCQEKEAAASCSRYCDCHLFELRRDLSESQVEQMLLTAERGGRGAEAIRNWLRLSALRCEKRVFGESDGAKATRE